MCRHWSLPAALLYIAVGPVSAADALMFPVPSISIGTGDMITNEMLTEKRLIANGIAQRTHFTSRNALVGKVAKRPIAVGSAIPINSVRDAYVFKEGERIKLQFLSGRLSISGSGIALQPGVLGQVVRVRNEDTGVIISGVVQGDGSVEVGGS